MRPLKLTMQAFGPYAGTETIDFRLLENRTMFVISGKTGAGKTTIFDGISYAIYGKASGEDRNGPDLRSQFADEDLPTEVTLEFTLRQKTYRITRSPQQEKKKKSGAGFTMIGARAEFYMIDESGEPKLLASNVREVDEKIKEIMIIDSNQFRQILMIPQGEFRKLLTSDSKDKEVILQRLFHTEIYKRVEEKLKEEATLLKKTVEDQIEKRNSSIRRIKAVENDELKEFLEADSVNDTLILPLLKEEISLMTSRLSILEEERSVLQKERDAQQQRLFEAETTIKQLQLLEDLRRKKKQLDGQRDNIAEKEAAAELGKKAAMLAAQEQICHRLKAEGDSLKIQSDKIAETIKQLLEKAAAAEAEEQKQLEREPERKAAADQISKLENMKEDIFAFAGITKQADELSKSLESTKEQKDKAVKTLEAAEAKLKLLHAEKEEAENSQLRLMETERQLEKINQEMDKLQKLNIHLQKADKATQQYQRNKSVLDNAEARLADSKATVIELEEKWLHSQAAVLAVSLREGHECPVCGSQHHPKPATSNDGFIPTEEDLKAAREQSSILEKEKNLAEKAYIESNAHVDSISSTVEEIISEISKDRTGFSKEETSDILLKNQSLHGALSNELKLISTKAGSLEKIKSEIKRFENGIHELKQQLKVLEESYHQKVILYTEAKTTLDRMNDKIPEGVRSITAFEAKLKDAMQKQKRLEQELEQAKKNYQDTKEQLGNEKARAEDAARRLKEKNEELLEEREAFKNKMAAQGFDSYQLYHQAKKSDRDISILEMEIRSFREELRSISDRYTEMANLLKDVKKPDLEALKRDFEALNEKIKAADEVYQDYQAKKRENEDILNAVDSLNEQMKVLEDRYKLIGHLYEISKGQNTYRITFERYVLAAFLDDILAEANGRLGKMTSGRYRLLRKTDRSKGNVQSGLELLVMDSYTGQERHVKTLSGGESFKAALSLALGLADVVQNYAGGVSLETMFIDEGFGTLDPESLDQAIEALIDIQSSGRLVGIISHVPELKERIDARLEVISAQTGSRTEFVLMN